MKVGGESTISDDAVKEKTGRSWPEWFKILDDWGAKEKSHKMMARYLMDEWDVSGWWSQTITIRYEQERGLRAVGQRSGGKFTVSLQRTIHVSSELAYDAFIKANLLSKWLEQPVLLDVREGGRFELASGDQGEFLILKRPIGIRMSWRSSETEKASQIDVSFEAKADSQVTVRIDHSKIKDEANYQKMKAYWTSAIDALKMLLENRED